MVFKKTDFSQHSVSVGIKTVANFFSGEIKNRKIYCCLVHVDIRKLSSFNGAPVW